MLTLEALVCFIDNHVIEHTGSGIFLFDVEVVVGYFVIKDSLRYFDGRLCLFHADEQGAQVDLCLRRCFVLKVKRYARQGNDQHHNGPHDAKERHAGSPH